MVTSANQPAQQVDQQGEVSQETAPNNLVDNLRAARGPRHAWLVEQAGVTATVTPLPDSSAHPAGPRIWSLAVDLSFAHGPWSIVAAHTDTPDAQVLSVQHDNTDTSVHTVVMRATAPDLCPAIPRREPVALRVHYQHNGQRSEVQLDVDYRCLIGDVVDPTDVLAHAALATKYQVDPLISRLVQRAQDEGPVLPMSEEIERLKLWLNFDSEYSVDSDPLNSLDPESAWKYYGSGYFLAPTETARYGGDCEDWSILLGAYLRLRGFEVYLANTVAHEWVRAVDEDGRIVDIDFVGMGMANPLLAPVKLHQSARL